VSVPPSGGRPDAIDAMGRWPGRHSVCCRRRDSGRERSWAPYDNTQEEEPRGPYFSGLPVVGGPASGIVEASDAECS
jgi:hypothetical protein